MHPKNRSAVVPPDLLPKKGMAGTLRRFHLPLDRVWNGGLHFLGQSPKGMPGRAVRFSVLTINLDMALGCLVRGVGVHRPSSWASREPPPLTGPLDCLAADTQALRDGRRR